MAGGIEHGFMSFTTDRGRVTEEAEHLRREAEEETARKRREVEEAERKRRETEEAERKRREAEGLALELDNLHKQHRVDNDLHEHLDVQHNDHATRRAFLREDARPEVPQLAITRSPWSKPCRAASGLTPPQKKACRT